MSQKRKIHFLEVQPHFLLVGKTGGFKSKEEYWSFASGCGYTGVTVAVRPEIVDLDRIVESSTYRDEWQQGFTDQGLDDGCSRLEAHTIMQNICLHPSRRLKFGPFVASQFFRMVDHRFIEQAAKNELRKTVDAAAALGHRYVAGFCGGRGYPAAQAKWPAYAKYWKEWVFALLATKWVPELEYAADQNIRLAFEIGHPENDLLTGANVILFWKMLTPKARKGMAVLLDGSHFVNVGVNPLPHGEAIVTGTTDTNNTHGVHFVGHCKWGINRVSFDGTDSPYGGFEDWDKSSTTFATYGIIGPHTAVKQHHSFLRERYEAQGEPDMTDVYEGECVFLKNPRLAMEIGFANINALNEGTALTELHEAVSPSQLPTQKPDCEGVPHLMGPQGRVDIDNDNWPPFDEFTNPPIKSWELLELSEDERAACIEILDANGFPSAAGAV